MRCSLASSCSKKVSHWYEMSTAQSPPFSRCSSTVMRPPEKAYLLTFSLICFGVSVQKIADDSSDAGVSGGGGGGSGAPASVLLDAMIKVLDTDGDGDVSREEYEALVQPMRRHSWTSRLRR